VVHVNVCLCSHEHLHVDVCCRRCKRCKICRKCRRQVQKVQEKGKGVVGVQVRICTSVPIHRVLIGQPSIGFGRLPYKIITPKNDAECFVSLLARRI